MKAVDTYIGARIDDPGSRCGDAAEWPELPNPATTTWMRSAFLGIWRAFAVGFFSSYALVESAVSIPFLAGARRLRARGVWLHRWCSFACRVLGIRVTTYGSMPPSG